MDFSLTDEQQRLVETARKFTREKIIPSLRSWTARHLPKRSASRPGSSGS